MVEDNEKFEAVEKKSVSADEHSEHMNLVGIAGGSTSSDSSITRAAIGAAAGATLGKTLPDLQISGAADRAAIAASDKIPATVAEGIINQVQGDRNREAAKAYGMVKDELVQLPQALQDKFFNMDRNKDGTLSQEQMAFIKNHLSKDAYGAAQVYNDAVRPNSVGGKLEGAEGKKVPNDKEEGRSPEQLASIAKKEAGMIRDAVSQLSPELQKEYGSMKPNKDGTLSNEQLSFIKNNMDKDTYATAQDYNRNMDALNRSMRGENVQDRIGMKMEAAKSIAIVDKAIGDLKPGLQKAYAQLDGAKDGGYSKEQLEFIKNNCPKEAYSAAQNFNRLNERLNSRDANGPAAGGADARGEDRATRPADGAGSPQERLAAFYKQELIKAEAVVNKQLAGMSPEMQKQFDQLPINKDGTYSDEQLAFLKQESKAAYLAASTYNAARSALNDIPPSGNQIERELKPVKPEWGGKIFKK